MGKPALAQYHLRLHSRKKYNRNVWNRLDHVANLCIISGRCFTNELLQKFLHHDRSFHFGVKTRRKLNFVVSLLNGFFQFLNRRAGNIQPIQNTPILQTLMTITTGNHRYTKLFSKWCDQVLISLCPCM